jgi:hypothetical protein
MPFSRASPAADAAGEPDDGKAYGTLTVAYAVSGGQPALIENTVIKLTSFLSGRAMRRRRRMEQHDSLLPCCQEIRPRPSNPPSR